MAYTDFTLSTLHEKFGVTNHTKRLFNGVQKLQPGPDLKKALTLAEGLPVRSEKAKSELIVIPVLLDLRERNDQFFTIHSGELLNVDEATGLRGECDFILAKDIGTFDIQYPIIQVVEAKKNDLDLGVPQCSAQMIGAQQYNQKKRAGIEKIYGCVTTGKEWLFILLENNELSIDSRTYFLNEIDEILGVFQEIISYYRRTI